MACASYAAGYSAEQILTEVLKCVDDEGTACDCEALKQRLKALEQTALQVEAVLSALLILLGLLAPLRGLLARLAGSRVGRILLGKDREALEAAARQREAAQQALEKMLKDLERERASIKSALDTLFKVNVQRVPRLEIRAPP